MKLLIDASSTLKTALRAGKDPEGYEALTENGKPVYVNTAAYGYENAINSIVSTLKSYSAVPSDLILVVEGFNSKARRLVIDRAYKAARAGKSCPALHEEFNKLKGLVVPVLKSLGAITVTQVGVEADDVIAYLADRIDDDVVIVSNDGDLTALVGKNGRGRSVVVHGRSGNPYGDFSARSITVYKALVGDASDGISGVKGFGVKAFQRFLEIYGDDGLAELARLAELWSLAELYEQAETCAVVAKIVAGEDDFVRSYRLAKLRPEWVNTLQNPLEWGVGMVAGVVGDERLKGYAAARRLVTADKWEAFKSWATKNITDWVALDIETSTTDESDDWLEAQDDAKGVDVIGSRLSGMSLTFGSNHQYTVYIPIDHVDTDCVKSEDLRDFIASLHDVKKVIHNTQFEGTVLFNEWGSAWADNGFNGFLPNWLDTKFEASYVDENNSLGLKKLSKKWLNYDQVEYDSVTTLEGAPGSLVGGRCLGEFKTSPDDETLVERRQYKMRELPARHVFDYACDDTVTTAALHNFFKLVMGVEGTWQVYLDVEIDASYLHTQSFVQGVRLDLRKLQELREIDDATYNEAWVKLSTYLISKGWDGCLPPTYDGEPTPKQIKEAYAIITGEELDTAVRHLGRLADAIEPGSLTLAEIVRARDWTAMSALVNSHFTGQPTFNPGSPKQMQKLFYETMGLQMRVFNAPTAVMKAKGIRQGTPQTNELAIKYAMQEAGTEEREALEAIRLMKMVNTRRGLYYDTYPYFVHWKTGLLHSSHNQCATNTRRASSSKPNTQQLPKHAKVEGQAARFREVIAPHKPGAVVVSMDFSSQEILLLAEWSHDPVLEQAFLGDPPLDLHCKTGVGIWNRNESVQMSYDDFKAVVDGQKHELHKKAKRYRALGKTVNFGSQYRMAAKKAASVLMVSESEAQDMLDAKAEAFPVSEAWALNEMEIVKESGISKTLLGAVRHLGPALMSEDRIEAGKAERQTLSFRIQGSAAEMTKRAEGAVWRERLVQRFDSRIYFPVHDEVVASVMVDDLYEFLPLMHSCMVQPYAAMRLPIRSSVSFGPSFGVQFETGNVGAVTAEEISAALDAMRAENSGIVWSGILPSLTYQVNVERVRP